jgi:hypothetical protein
MGVNMKFPKFFFLLLLLVPMLAFGSRDGGSSGGGHDNDPSATGIDQCIASVYADFFLGPWEMQTHQNDLARAMANICGIERSTAKCIDQSHLAHPDSSIREIREFCQQATGDTALMMN